jgi:glycosyltransferase involved in cell wall biosynthesis
MHLAIVSPYPPAITGIGQYGYHVSNALANSSAFSRITLLTSQTSQSWAIAVPPNVTIERTWRSDRIDIGRRIVARLYQLHPDIVWFNMGATVFGRSVPANISGLLSPAVIQRLGVPCVLTMHEMAELADLRLLKVPGGLLSSLGAHWVTWALTQADVVCLTLKTYTEWLAARRPGKRYIHIPIGMYHHPQLLDEPPTPDLLFFTTLAPFKGLVLLLDACRLVRDRFPLLKLTISVAEHPRFPGYMAHMQHNYRHVKAVRWLGYVPEANVGEVFRQCQVVVLPYTAATGSSSVLYQAMMWGRPIVASGLPELRSAVDEVNLKAEFFTSGNTLDLANAITRMLSSPELRKQHVMWNHQATCRLDMDETCHAYLRAFNLALRMRSTADPIRLPSEATTESI